MMFLLSGQITLSKIIAEQYHDIRPRRVGLDRQDRVRAKRDQNRGEYVADWGIRAEL